ncbi:hypothetical protein [Paenibacillus etheri]|uniref:hypothetical protein n=1 Tax=Paenibacillus etheri TaxID=1306852 RepID=UPI001AE00A3B|nr:hypothetical protein [Paenibacillus etheri]
MAEHRWAGLRGYFVFRTDLPSNLIQRTLAFYEVRVPQTGDLSLAYFRFHLTVDTFALSLWLLLLLPFGLKPIDSAHVRLT